MSDSSSTGFAQFVPGFDFLQNLAKNTTQSVPQMPNMTSWIAPTLSVEELEKRIAELKAVHFWLDQNSKALAATVQALEVQKMTLATLKGMNLNLGELANAFKLKPTEPVASNPYKATEPAAAPVQTVREEASKTEEVAKAVDDAEKPAAALVDPMQLWTSLTQQFQTIAASAMAEAGKVTAMDMGKSLLKGAAKASAKPAASAPAKKAPAKRAATKTPAKKATKTATSKSAGLRRR